MQGVIDLQQFDTIHAMDRIEINVLGAAQLDVEMKMNDDPVIIGADARLAPPGDVHNDNNGDCSDPSPPA